MTTEAQIYALGNLPNRRNAPNSAATPNKPPILPKLSTNYEVIITNKPNFPDAQMNVNNLLTRAYENETLSGHGENKPKTNPIYRGVASGEAGFQRQKMPLSTFLLWDVVPGLLCCLRVYLGNVV